ncbi:hypothetical protein Tco_1412661, partial [Tanacetum coccineum]
KRFKKTIYVYNLMEDLLKSKEAMEEWKSFIASANVDIFDVLKNAIKVAASDHPNEFRTMRDKIAEMLFSRELINYCGGGDMFKKQSMNVSCEVQDETIDKVLRIKAILDKSKIDDESKGPLNPEQKVADKSYGDEYELGVCDSVKKLQHVGVTINSDHHTTGIGKTLQKHAFRDVMDEWLNKKSSVVKPISVQDKPKSLDMERKINSGKTIVPKVPRVAPDQQCKSRMNSKEATNNKSGPTNTSFQEKLEATKRKFQQHYMEEENLKKKRRIQVLELHEVIKKGRIPPKDQQPDNLLVDHGRNILERLTGADMQNAVQMVAARYELQRIIAEKEEMIMSYRQM